MDTTEPEGVQSAQNRDFEQALVKIIDLGCGSSDSTGASNLSKYCLSNLFELCRYEGSQTFNPTAVSPSNGEEIHSTDDENNSPDIRISKIKQKMASMTTPVLINRC